MNRTLTLSPRRLVVAGIVALLALAAYGFAATNTVDNSNAGDGAGSISGYNASNIHYVLDGTNPANATSVTFTITPALPPTGTSRISFNDGASWLTCSGTATVTCAGPVAIGATATSLRVVAAQ